MGIELELIGKPGCHLCDDARQVVETVAADYGLAVSLTERSILDDEALHDEFWEQIPVVRIDGRVHDYWRIDANRLRAGIDAAVARLGA